MTSSVLLKCTLAVVFLVSVWFMVPDTEWLQTVQILFLTVCGMQQCLSPSAVSTGKIEFKEQIHSSRVAAACADCFAFAVVNTTTRLVFDITNWF